MAAFTGFSYPDDKRDDDPEKLKGFTRIPNDWFDVCVQINNLAELKIVLYMIRHTWGFQDYKEAKQISVDEFAHGCKRRDGMRMDNGTGLGLTAVKDGIKRAIEHGYLLYGVNKSDLGRIKKYYLLRMRDWKPKNQ